jgi:hypothetical protein
MLYVDGVFVYYLVETLAGIEAFGLRIVHPGKHQVFIKIMVPGTSRAGQLLPGLMPRPKHGALRRLNSTLARF